ncbi:NAD(P)-binding protein [Leucogyrophana mollusca]|uniref:NAD(P)-binding protein n=1 Tax=Leucogyrophana mollusca TaxID=85980 RepID=A0ACB8BZC1_9AGAM|nr:NAD(P)-binding protein [Leucogyrophana mollusca]
MSSETKGTAIVTGAAQGIGRSIALRLASDGFDVALNDLAAKKPQLDEVSQEIIEKGRRTVVVCADVSVEEDVKGMVDTVVQELGGVDVMVANAGIVKLGSVLQASVEDWENIFAINTRGVFLCYKYAALRMVEQGRGGRIIGASSMAGKRGLRIGVAYSASKFAVRGLTQSAALELGPHGITVNTYAPGAINTPMTIGVQVPSEIDPDESLKKLVAQASVGYIGQPEDIASVVSYLSSKEAHFITGQSISVDGGIVLS